MNIFFKTMFVSHPERFKYVFDTEVKAVRLLHSYMSGLSNELESLKAQGEETGMKLNTPG